MRLFVLCAALAGACSAVDDFGAFRFADDGGAGDAGAATDLTPPLPSTVGAACTGSCGGGLGCVMMVGNTTFPGGFCTKPCDPQMTFSCPTGSDCRQIDNMNVCVPVCNPPLGPPCRTDYSCCAGGKVVVGPGNCAPTTSTFCGG